MIDKLRNWFDANYHRHSSPVKPAYWSVLPSMGSQKSYQVNYEVDDLEGSWQMLEDYIIGQFSNGVRQLVIAYKTAKNDGSPCYYTLKNPSLGSSSNNGIFGMGGHGAVSQGIGQIMQLQNENHRTQLQAIQENHKRDLEQLKTEFQHTREIEDLRGEMNAMHEEKMTFWDKVLDRIETNGDIIAPVIEGLVTKLMPPKTQVGIAGVTTAETVPPIPEREKESEETVQADLNIAAKAAMLLAKNGYKSDLLLRAATFLVEDEKKASFLISQLPKL